jgi:hypothetical protein
MKSDLMCYLFICIFFNDAFQQLKLYSIEI